MADIIVGLLLVLAVGGALYYIRRQKKNGVKCIGCPSSGSCSKNCGCGGSSKNTAK